MYYCHIFVTLDGALKFNLLFVRYYRCGDGKRYGSVLTTINFLVTKNTARENLKLPSEVSVFLFLQFVCVWAVG